MVIGYVGLVIGAPFSKFSLNVICIDSGISKISILNNGDYKQFYTKWLRI